MVTSVSLFIFLAGFVVGLGAVTVIDLHGFLARHSSYWTVATIRAHKVTKPLIWIGVALAIAGGTSFYINGLVNWIPITHAIVAFVLIINGLFLSFYVSPYLLRQEKEGRDQELLPSRLQKAITVSFLVSFVGWWGSLALLSWYLINYI
ncbi:MAG: hypothetical protein ACLFNN_02165 [Candidatus Paceibacterota bacterium]